MTYHSIHGAVTESLHVFIDAGLNYLAEKQNSISVFEMGFGTGLNALLTYQHAQHSNCVIHYDAIEQFPLPKEITDQLEYPAYLGDSTLRAVFDEMHQAPFISKEISSPEFVLNKINQDINDLKELPSRYDVIYFDAFAPNSQAELWEPNILTRCFDAMHSGGVLVTYCAKGQLRRDLQSVGFVVERLPGPPGKREMLRATRPWHLV